MNGRGAPASTWWSRTVDGMASTLSPAWGARRKAWRMIAGQVEKLYRAGTRSRLDPAAGDDDGNSLLTAHRAAIVDRARQLERDNFIADGILTRLVENVNGPEGFRLRARTGNPDVDKALEARWTRYDELEADVRGMVSFSGGDGIMSHVVRSGLRDGDVLLERRADGAVGIIEADRIETPPEMATESAVTDGVRVHPDTGRPATFYVGEEDAPGMTRYQELAFEDVEFFARRPRHSYVRGVSLFSKPWVYEQLNAFIEALVVNQRVAACFGVLIKSGAQGMPSLDTTTNSGGDAQAGFNLEPGMVKYLGAGEEVEQLKPMQPSTMLGEFMKIMGQFAGLPAGLPLELAFLDFSHTNYSSARAALLQAQRAFRVLQSAIRRIYSAVYRWQVRRWLAAGEIQLPSGMSPADLEAHVFEAPGWQWVDPLKEAQAHGLAVALGFESRGEVTRAMGRDPEEVLEELAKEEAKRRELGVPGYHVSNVKPVEEREASPGTDGSESDG